MEKQISHTTSTHRIDSDKFISIPSSHYIITRHDAKIVQIELVTKQHLVVTIRIHVHAQFDGIDVGDIEIVFIPNGAQSALTHYLVLRYWIQII